MSFSEMFRKYSMCENLNFHRCSLFFSIGSAFTYSRTLPDLQTLGIIVFNTQTDSIHVPFLLNVQNRETILAQKNGTEPVRLFYFLENHVLPQDSLAHQN